MLYASKSLCAFEMRPTTTSHTDANDFRSAMRAAATIGIFLRPDLALALHQSRTNEN